ncbi:MAG TPA: tyrosine-type recombinase/integrase [Acidimicrobiales bacterium]|nr:tyrosine-type recombinase/integrase [Acidimicrobiales bacterium]
MIEHHLAQYVGLAPDALVFPAQGGTALGRNKFRPIWGAACRCAGVVGLHLHDLRHSGLTWTASAGATTAELMYRAGHSSPTVAMRYQHAQQHRDQAIADKLGALIRASSAEAPTDASTGVVPISRQ